LLSGFEDADRVHDHYGGDDDGGGARVR